MSVPNDSAKVLTMVERVSRAKGWWGSARNGWYINKHTTAPGYFICQAIEPPSGTDSWCDVNPLTALLWTLLACLDDVEGEPARLLLDAHEDRNDAREHLTVLADHWAGGEVTTTVVVDVPEKWSEPYMVDVKRTGAVDNGKLGSVRPVGRSGGSSIWIAVEGQQVETLVALATTRLESRNLAPTAAWITAWLDGWRGETRETFGAEMMAAAKDVWERLTVVCDVCQGPHFSPCHRCGGHGRVPKHGQPEDTEYRGSWSTRIDGVRVTVDRSELMVLKVGDAVPDVNGDYAYRVDGIEHSMDHEPFQLEQDPARAIEGTQRVTVTLRSLGTGDTSELRAAWRI